MTLGTIRRLTEEGLEQFRALLAARRAGIAPRLLDPFDPALTLEIMAGPKIDTDGRFANKWEFGQYAWEVIAPLRGKPVLDADAGTWSWVVLLFLEQFIPAGSRPLADEHYIPTFDRKRYRHLARTPYELFGLHGDAASAPLSLAVSEHGELSEQLLSRVELYRNRAFFLAVSQLYGEGGGKTFKLKRGALSRNKRGTLRRLMKVFRQFDLTYDLQGMSPEEILGVMPREFERFATAR